MYIYLYFNTRYIEKLHMLKFHDDVIHKKSSMKYIYTLIYSDTDSLIYYIIHPDKKKPVCKKNNCCDVASKAKP